MRTELTREWCEQMARQEIEAGFYDIEAGGVPVADIPEASLSDSRAPIQQQTTHRRSRAQGAENLAKQELEKL
ncbi:MAG: hypothetical protein FWH56_00915 [Betaproteobacteria bacterium]|nr:hypothetical protein [Betaproteobacteria bacterium]